MRKFSFFAFMIRCLVPPTPSGAQFLSFLPHPVLLQGVRHSLPFSSLELNLGFLHPDC